jgi:hypothetical protein
MVVVDRKERKVLADGGWGRRTYSVEEKEVEEGL